jgi:hypothetical protein
MRQVDDINSIRLALHLYERRGEIHKRKGHNNQLFLLVYKYRKYEDQLLLLISSVLLGEIFYSNGSSFFN